MSDRVAQRELATRNNTAYRLSIEGENRMTQRTTLALAAAMTTFILALIGGLAGLALYTAEVLLRLL